MTDLTPARLEELERLADFANFGATWPPPAGDATVDELLFLEAATPETVRALVFEVRRLRRASALRLRTEAPELCGTCGAVLLFSARQRGDGLCGPCSRGEAARG